MAEHDPTEQLQRAALEAVRAARKVLDAAEAAIADPEALESVVRTVTSMARATGETVLGFAAGMAADRARPAGGAPEGDPPPDHHAAPGHDDGDGDDPDAGFHRIVVD